MSFNGTPTEKKIVCSLLSAPRELNNGLNNEDFCPKHDSGSHPQRFPCKFAPTAKNQIAYQHLLFDLGNLHAHRGKPTRT